MINRKSTLFCSLLVLLLVWGTSGWAQSSNKPASPPEPDPDRYIVKFVDGAKGRAALQAAGARIELDLPNHNAAAAHIPERALQALTNNPSIEYIEPDHIREPTTTNQITPYGIAAVQADLVVQPGLPANRKICIIDSGYSVNHEDLAGNLVTGTDDVDGTGHWHVDACGHGTHVAGTIAAVDDLHGVLGVLPENNINLHIVKVFGDNCSWTYSSSLVAAADICEGAGADIINMSLSGTFKSRFEEAAFNGYYDAGLLSVAAAGNERNTRKRYPASYNSVISVAAVDSAKAVASFSVQNDKVELAAPGVAVKSTVPMGTGSNESLDVDGTGYEAVGMQGSPNVSGTGDLFECNFVDGLGTPGDCTGASGKVCLIQRGDITFADKVLECEDKDGIGAVIYNNQPSLFSGTLGDTTTNIPSVGISGTDGLALVDIISDNNAHSATVTTGPGHYSFFDGTSMATPHVAGVAALVWSQNTTCTNQQVRDALNASALDLGEPGRDVAYGYGLVRAKAADDHLTPNCGSDTPVDNPPTVTVTDPADGATVSGSVDVIAIATDDNDGVSVTFSVYDVNNGTSESLTPVTSSTLINGDTEWSATWDATSLSDGLYKITATVTDSNSQFASDTNTVTIGTLLCEPVGETCSDDAECCSNKCKGKTGRKTCK